MKIAIHQPNYLPWLGFFNKLAQVDVFVLLDVTPYSKNNIQNRNQIKTPAGPLWLTVPVKTQGHFGQTTHTVEIDNRQRWRDKHWKSLVTYYRKAPAFAELAERLQPIYETEWTHLSALSERLIRLLADYAGFAPRIVRASDLPIAGERIELLLAICHTLQAREYVAGQASRAYMDDARFASAGVTVRYTQFQHPVYPQLYGAFAPNLSALDLFFNCGQAGAALLRTA